MIVRGVGRAIAGLALVLAVSACDDNPLAEDRDEGAYFRLNPSSVAVNAGGTVEVEATVLNKYGAATNDAVTAVPCDNRITATVDTSRTDYEFPERFVVTGHTLGLSCLVVNGGGVTDTIQVRVVPATFNIETVDTIRSGSSAPAQVEFFTEDGTPVTGFSVTDVTWTSLSPSVGVVDESGVITGRAPGTGRVVARLAPMYAVARVDTLSFEVVAGDFTGTFAPGTAPMAGTEVTFTEGTAPIDADTRVTFDGIPTFVTARDTVAGTITVIVPGGTQTTSTFVLSNLGPDQISSEGTINVTDPNSDEYEPNDSFATATLIPSTDATYYYTLSEDDQDDYYVITMTAPGSVTFTNDWNDPGMLSVLLGMNSLGEFVYDGCFAASKPQSCTFDLPAGTTYINLWRYPAPAGDFPAEPTYPAITGRWTVDFE